jgi:hypothetical protein
LDCAAVLCRPFRAKENWLVTFTWGFARRFTPGCHMTGFQPSPGRSALTLEACRKEEARNMPRSPRFGVAWGGLRVRCKYSLTCRHGRPVGAEGGKAEGRRKKAK